MNSVIEDAVRKRQIRRVHALLKPWLRRNRASFEAKCAAADWLRRIGSYREAYSLIAPSQWNFRKLASSAQGLRRLLWSARLLNAMGASRFAEHLLDRIEFSDPKDCKIAGLMELSLYRYDRARDYLSKAIKYPQLFSDYEMKLLMLAIADVTARAADPHEALALTGSFSFSTGESLLQGIVLQARGEYFWRSGKNHEALQSLEKAALLLPQEDVSADRGFLYKWMGIVKSSLGRLEEGLVDLERAIDILRNPQFREEMWLECLAAKRQFGCANAIEERLVDAFPGLSSSFHRVFQRRANSIGFPGGPLFFWLERDEYETSTDRPTLGIPKELRLAAILRTSEGYGIGLERLKCILWPDDAAVFPYLESRLFQLARRLKTEHDIEVKVFKRRMHLEQIDAIGVRHDFTTSSPRFFESFTTFTSADFSDYYRLSRSQTHAVLKKFVQNGKLAITRRDGRFLYRVDG